MIRIALALAVLAGVARADTLPDPKPSPPDPNTEASVGEANLESKAPRQGTTFSASLGGGLVLGDGVGRGGSGSLRLGHVATPDTVVTLEVTGSALLHGLPMSQTLHNDDVNLMAGALYYAAPSLWIRGAGGATIYSVQTQDIANGPIASHSHGGAGGLVGLGIDLLRWHYLVLGLEAFSAVSIVGTKGLMMTNALCLGLTYY